MKKPPRMNASRGLSGKHPDACLALGFFGSLKGPSAAVSLPPTHGRLFQIASNSKLFTATLALTLVDEGTLQLDAPVRTGNPAFTFNDTYGLESLTARDLMSHRTGLPRHDRITFGFPSRREVMDKLRWLELDKPARALQGPWLVDGGRRQDLPSDAPR